jgi:hypothetical protein
VDAKQTGPTCSISIRSGTLSESSAYTILYYTDHGATTLGPGTVLPDDTCHMVTFSPPLVVSKFDLIALHVSDMGQWSSFQIAATVSYIPN